MFELEAKSVLADKRRTETLRRETLINDLKRDGEFLKFYNALNSARFDMAKAKAFNTRVEETEKAFSVARTAFFEYLKSVNVSPEQLEETAECKSCGDTGYTPDGKRCACLNSILKELNSELGDLPHTSSDFADFDISKYSGDAKTRATTAAEWLRKWTAAYPNISRSFVTLYGATGVGKTHLAAIAANAFMDKGLNVTFIKAYRLNELFLKAMLSPLSEKQGLLDSVFNCDLLVIDDLGTEEFYKNVTAEYLYMTIVEREKNATIITTNLTPDMIKDRYQERIYSRLFDKNNTAPLFLTGDDLRITKK